MFSFLKKLSFKTPYLLAVPVIGVTGASGYAVWKYSDTASSIEHNYLARVQFNLLDSTSSSGTQKFISKKIEGKTYDFSNSSIRDQVVSETRNRLLDFYRKYGSRDIKINLSNDLSKSADFFLHIKSTKEDENPNSLWLNNVKLNQLSIDRYGNEFDASGVKKSDSTAKVHPIVRWSDIGVSDMSYKSPEKGIQAHIEFNFYNNDISEDEVKILINEDETKYKKEKQSDTSNDWFVWLDKDLLALKINYILQTYVFSQPGAELQNSISSLVGNSSQRDPNQALRYQTIQNNFNDLSDREKEFADNYIKTFIDIQTEPNKSVDWSKVVTQVTTESYFIKPDDINKIFNRFSSQQKDISIFEPYLVTTITSGKGGNWKKVLNLSETKAEDSKGEVKKAEEKQDDEEKKGGYEIRKIEKISDSSNEETRNKNTIKLFSNDPIKGNSKLQELHELVTKYSVRHLDLKTSHKNNDWTSSVYSPLNNKTEEIFYVLSIPHSNEYGLYSNYVIPAILGILFLIAVSTLIVKSFKAPGGFFVGGIFSGVTAILGIFFALGSKLSLVGIMALVTGVFYALFLTYFILGFLKKLFELEFLDKANIFVTFKRGIVFSADLTLPLFTLSTLIAFLAPLHLREFGIILSLSILVFFLLIPLFSTKLALHYVYENFLKVSNFLRAIPNRQEKFLHNWAIQTLSNKSLLNGYVLVAGLFFLALLIFIFSGFNSFSIFKENYLITLFVDNSSLASGKTLDSVNSALSETEILKNLSSSNAKFFGSNGGTTSYLVESKFDSGSLLNLLKENLKDGSYYIQSTNAFNEELTALDLSKLIGFSFLFISIYVLIRFRFTNLAILLLNTFITLFILISGLIVLRISLYSSVFLGVCVFFAASIMYHIYYFSIEKLNRFEWFDRISFDISNNIFWLLKFSILCFLVASLFTTNEEVILSSLYTSLSLFTVHYLCSAFYFVFKDKLEQFKEVYMWRKDTTSEEEEHDGTIDLDPYDEEIILGINKGL